MSKKILIEGGGESKELQSRCREGFSKLLKSCGYEGRMPRLVACGGRARVYKDFSLAHSEARDGQFVAMLLDSEDPVENPESPWRHLKVRDNWDQPNSADDNQVLLMTTCMETWVATDRKALKDYYGSDFQPSALPSLTNIEAKSRQSMHDALKHATRNCPETYEKGANSFKILSKLNPSVLEQHLPSFQRVRRVLDENL